MLQHGEPGGRYAKWNKPVPKRQILSDTTAVSSPEESSSWGHSILVGARDWGWGMGSSCLKGVSFMGWRALEVEAGDSQQCDCSQWTVTNSSDGKLCVVCILPQTYELERNALWLFDIRDGVLQGPGHCTKV